jgi:hypothetical protein
MPPELVGGGGPRRGSGTDKQSRLLRSFISHRNHGRCDYPAPYRRIWRLQIFLLGNQVCAISMLAGGISRRDLMLCLGRFRPLWNGRNFQVSYFSVRFNSLQK